MVKKMSNYLNIPTTEPCGKIYTYGIFAPSVIFANKTQDFSSFAKLSNARSKWADEVKDSSTSEQFDFFNRK